MSKDDRSLRFSKRRRIDQFFAEADDRPGELYGALMAGEPDKLDALVEALCWNATMLADIRNSLADLVRIQVSEEFKGDILKDLMMEDRTLEEYLARRDSRAQGVK